MTNVFQPLLLVIAVDQTKLARLGHITRARVTQIMNLLHLDPAIQEELLFLPLIEHGRDSILERQLRPIAAVADWRKQRRMWKELRAALAMTIRSKTVLLDRMGKPPC